MRILVTGAAGFIGSNTCDLLVRENHIVHGIDNFSTGRESNLSGDYKVREADVTKSRQLIKIADEFRPDAVLHLAAQSAITTSWEDPTRDLAVNAIGTLNVIEMCKRHNARLVFSSTSAVYGSVPNTKPLREFDHTMPDTPYGISKFAAESYIYAMHEDCFILRYGNVYGPRQVPVGQNQVIARALRHFSYGDDFHVVGSGEQKRDFVYVEDVARANMFAIEGDEIARGIYNVASGKSYSVNEVVDEIANAYDVPGYPWEHSGEDDPRGDVFLSPRTINEFGLWEARVSLKEGIGKTVDWWNEVSKHD